MDDHKLSSKIFIDANQKIKERDYWLNQLSGELRKVSFPYDRFRTNEFDREIETLDFKITGKIFDRLMQISNNSDIRLLIILMTSVVAMLEKYTGNNDIIIGSPVDRQENQSNFMNTVLILRNLLTEEMTIKELLMKVSRGFAEAAEHVNYPLEALLYQLNIPYAEDGDFPLVDVAVWLENIQDKSYINHLNINAAFSFLRTGDAIEGKLAFNTFLYEPRKMEIVIGHFFNLLENSLFELDKPLAQLSLLSTEEEEKLLTGFNGDVSDYPEELTLHQRFEEQVKRNPTRCAVRHMTDSLTYLELDARANQVAGLLKEKGVQTGEIVALMVERSVEMIVGILGILKAGAAYLPINPEYPASRIDYMLEDSEAKILMILGEPGQDQPGAKIVREIVNLQEKNIYERVAAAVPAPVDGSALAYVIYTSGSTGNPKGVLIEHRHVSVLVDGLDRLIYRRYGGGLNVALVAPYVFDASVQQIFASLVLGQTLDIVPEDVRVDGEMLVQFFIDNKIDITDGTPSHLKQMLMGLKKKAPGLSLKHLIIGGEAMPQKVAELFLNCFVDNPVTITNIYGPAECCVDVSSFDVTKENVSQLQAVPIGKPMPNRRIYILNRYEGLQPIGVMGELCIGGEGVGRGYLKRDQLTAEKFIDDPFNRGGRLYKTGDIARWKLDGNIEFMGRLDHQVKIRGFRIEMGEIENQLRKHNEINDVLVVPRTDEDGDTSLYCYVVADRSFEVMELRDFLGRMLPEYMIPSYFITISEFPLTAHGKIDIKALPDPELKASGSYIAPRDDFEVKLAETWADVLKIDLEAVSVNSDFFALGGHSLKATTLITRIHKDFNVKVPIAQIFETPTFEGLANYIKGTGQVEFVSIQPAPRKEHYVLSPHQRRFYYQQQMALDSTAYNVPFIMVVKAEPDREKLEQTFHTMIQRHDILRTSFHVVDEEPVQKVWDEYEFEVNYFDTTHEKVKKLIPAFIRPFDLEKAPLVRVASVNIENSRWMIIVDIHHIICDGVSTEVLIDEFKTIFDGNQPAPLRLQYKDFAEWLNTDEQIEALEEQGQYWLDKFSDDIPLINLPVDFPRQRATTFKGKTVNLELDAETTYKLKEIATQCETTLYMVLMSIYNVALGKISAQEDIVIGSAVSGRPHEDLAKLIGLFFNTIALRNFPTPGKTFSGFLKEVSKSTLEAFENQDYPFDKLVHELTESGKLERVPGRNPLFDTMFALGSYVEQTDTFAGVPVDLEMTEDLAFRGENAKFDLLLNVLEREYDILFSMDYSTQLYAHSTIETFMDYYLEVLNQIVEDKDILLGDITISRDSADLKSSFDAAEMDGFNL